MVQLTQAELGALGAAAVGLIGALVVPRASRDLVPRASRDLVPRASRDAVAHAPRDAVARFASGGRVARDIGDAGRALANTAGGKQTSISDRSLVPYKPSVPSTSVLERVLPVAAAGSVVARALRGIAPQLSAEPSSSPHIRAARRLNRAAGVLATSVLADSAVEHYRGSFENRAMYTPLAVASASLAVSAHGLNDTRTGAHAVRDTVYALAGLTGVVGTGFHIYNITKRPGGFSWVNLFYGAPLGAPFALVLSGLLGFTAERVRENPPNVTPRILGLPAGRAMAALSAMGMAGTVGEASLLHFRGAFHDPAMFIPVTVPPVAAGLLADTAVVPRGKDRWFTRLWLRLTAAVGVAGVGFHIFGVARNMGGWRNWRQNVLNGPPIPAPPSFTGLALAGLAALRLLEDHPDA